jgi:hypothetical protein
MLRMELPVGFGDGVGGDRERSTAVVLYVPPNIREAILPAGYHRDREAFAGETAGDRSPESWADPEDRRNSSVHGILVSSVGQALPDGNSNLFRDSGFISAE